jgi:hypothetical protein
MMTRYTCDSFITFDQFTDILELEENDSFYLTRYTILFFK